VPATSSIEERARELKRFLVEHNGGEKDVNLVAHSMGGLDARFLASHLSKGVNVRSITTISTPHRGSPVADFFMDTFGIGAKGLVMEELGRESTKEGANASRDDSIKRLLDLLVRMVDAPAYGNLTSKYLTQTFNPSTPDNANVLYYSYGGFVQRPSSLSWLRVPWEIVYQKEGDNDGVVSIYSSRWGKFIRSVEGDHFFLKRHIPPTLEEAAAGTPTKAENSTQADSHVQTVLKLLRAIRASSNIVASSSSSSQPQPQQQLYKEIVDARLKRVGPASAAKEGYYYGLDQEYDDTDDLRKTCLYMDIMNRLAEDGL
jgi:pimeloyl-ACP methyl ester carboxylesterase